MVTKQVEGRCNVKCRLRVASIGRLGGGLRRFLERCHVAFGQGLQVACCMSNSSYMADIYEGLI